MTHDPSPHDDAKRANRIPDDASTDDIAAALRGRRLFDVQLAQKIDGCRRCQEKNIKRRYAGVDLVDQTLEDDDAVTVHAAHTDSGHAGPHWLITSAEHRHHDQLPFEDVASSGTDLVRAHARVHATENKHILDIDIVERSPRGEGPEQSTIEKQWQQYIDDDAGTAATVINRNADEPPAHWPEEDRQWLQQLADAHTLEVPTYDIAEDDPSDANPGVDAR